MATVEELVKPYQILHIFDAAGNYAASQVKYQDILKVDGVVKSRTERIDPVQVDQADLPALYSDVEQGALIKVDELQAELAEMKRTMAAAQLSAEPFKKVAAETREELANMTKNRDAEKARADAAERRIGELQIGAKATEVFVEQLADTLQKAKERIDALNEENGALKAGGETEAEVVEAEPAAG